MDTLDDRYFDRLFDDVSREHVKQLQTLKGGSSDERATQRQIALISSLLLAVVKLRNFRKQLAEKRD
jgi:hypothetical protein